MFDRLPSFGHLWATVGAYSVVLYLIIAPLPHGSWMRSAQENQAHGAEALLHASMLQPADSCPDGHFHGDEGYGYWVQDFQMILGGPSADSIFSVLRKQRQPLAQVYGLIGLSVTNRILFEHLATGYAPPDTSVLVADSCHTSERRIQDLMPAIHGGYWGRRLTERPVDIH